MILAAGRGERLKPLTNTTPKALCSIADRPIIDYHLHNLAAAGFTKVVINHAHLGWKIRNYLQNRQDLNLEIVFSPEPPGGLETGGGIYHALKNFETQAFAVINADIYSDYDLKNIRLPDNSLAHLILTETPKGHRADFGLNKSQLINSPPKYTFSGIACYSPDFFKNTKSGRFSVTPILRYLAEQNKVSGELFTGKWIDIGTIDKLNLANNQQRRKAI